MKAAMKPYGLTDAEWNTLQWVAKGKRAYFWQIPKVIRALWFMAAAFLFVAISNSPTVNRWFQGIVFLSIGLLLLALETYDYFVKRKLARKLGLI